uniref:Ubiquitin-like modifier-activating enzyme ATG7 n=1 Tax=Rhabditophanes sp. KR3021 TaxID=114890 RepID=A0AC35TH92_9BILA
MAFQVQPFKSRCDPVFWNLWSSKKLNEWKLNQGPVFITAKFGNNGLKRMEPELRFSEESFSESISNSKNESVVRGVMYPLNNLEDFRDFKKKDVLEEMATKMWKESIESWKWLEDPSSLISFILLTYGDLKKHEYYHISCIPSFILLNNLKVSEETTVLNTIPFNINEVPEDWAFVIDSVGTPLPLTTLKEYDIKGESLSDLTIAFKCSSTKTKLFGWPIRNLLTACANLINTGNEVKLVAYRTGGISSTISTVTWDPLSKDVNAKNAVGWEKKADGNYDVHYINLSSQMNPMIIAKQANSLNVSLIKWRLVPELDINVFEETKILMLGSGTLGCNVTRAVIGWGVTKITFVDNSLVSYSNPARQSFYTVQDAIDKKEKCKAAAEALKKIIPHAETNAFTLNIPMPGHIIDEKCSEESYRDFKLLDELISSHDVIFMLLDSREGRWLPTLLAAVHNKLAITVGLGFDSYVILRHGINLTPEVDNEMCKPGDTIPANKLGCFFCNDITSPGNSLADRTLDMKCTVTRAGNSLNAAGNAGELFASIMQHPLKGGAPHVVGSHQANSSLLGAVPHQLRGSLSGFQQNIYVHQRSKSCIACGDEIQEAYKGCTGLEQKWHFIRKIVNDNHILEELTGLTKKMELADHLDDKMLSFDSDSDDF